MMSPVSLFWITVDTVGDVEEIFTYDKEPLPITSGPTFRSHVEAPSAIVFDGN